MNASNLLDPVDQSPFGDMAWLVSKTGWTKDKIARLCRLKAIPGAIQAQPGIRGSAWTFRKEKVLRWLASREN